eukprot:SAG31_NODE_12873_length_910_cov_0.727497_1_plen_296_part_10
MHFGPGMISRSFSVTTPAVGTGALCTFADGHTQRQECISPSCVRPLADEVPIDTDGDGIEDELDPDDDNDGIDDEFDPAPLDPAIPRAPSDCLSTVSQLYAVQQQYDFLIVNNPYGETTVSVGTANESASTDPHFIELSGCGAPRCRAPQPVNVALGGTASQSSASHGGAPSLAIDGNHGDGVYAGTATCTHTLEGPNEWWQVDLGAPYIIDDFRLYHRTDCCADRLNGARVVVSPTSDYTSGGVDCSAVTEGGNAAQPEVGDCGGALGQFITVAHSNRFLTICEFEAMAKAGSSC